MIPLLYIGLSQAFFAGFIVFTKKPRYLHDLVAGFWLLTILAETSLSLYIELGHFSNEVLNISLILPLTYMPFMYLYARTIISETPKFRPRDILHFLPFLLFLLLTAAFGNEELFYGQSQKWPLGAALFRMIFSAYFMLTLIFYSVRVLRLIQDHQRKIKDSFSFTSEMITLNWLKFILVLFVVSFIGLFSVGMMVDSANYPFDPRLFTRVALTIFAFGVSYFGVKQPTLYKPSTAVEATPRDDDTEKTKYRRSGLTDEQANDYLSRLQDYMQSARPFLDPELTIKDIADHLHISRHYITQIINEKLNKNFFQWINDYRIEEVKKLLLDPRYDHLTIVALAYDCGFNSKSAFNAIFKKSTGRTPSEYRRVQT